MSDREEMIEAAHNAYWDAGPSFTAAGSRHAMVAAVDAILAFPDPERSRLEAGRVWCDECTPENCTGCPPSAQSVARLEAVAEAAREVVEWAAEALAIVTDPASEDYEPGDEDTADALISARLLLGCLRPALSEVPSVQEETS